MAEHPVLTLVAAVGRDHLAAVPAAAEHADDAALRRVEPAHRLGLGLARLAADQARQHAGAFRQFFARRTLDQPEQRRLLRSRPRNRPHQRKAIGVVAGALDRHHLGKRCAGGKAPVAATHQLARSGDGAQHRAQRRLIGGAEAKGAGDLTGAERLGIGAQKFEQRLRRGQPRVTRRIRPVPVT